MANSQNLEDMKLPELKELAKQMGLRGTSTMRKPELVATLQAARTGGQAPSGVTVRPQKNETNQTTRNDAQDEDSVAHEEVHDNVAVSHSSDETVSLSRKRRIQRHDNVSEPAGKDLLEELNLVPQEASQQNNKRSTSQHEDTISESEQRRRRRRALGQSYGTNDDEQVRDLDDILAALPVQKSHDEGKTEVRDRESSRRSNRFERNANNRGERSNEERANDRADNEHTSGERNTQDRNRNERNASERSERNEQRNDRNTNDRHQRRLRGRDRDREYEERDEREEHEEIRDSRREEVVEDFVPVAGIVDVLESYAFVRTSGYLPGPNDVYVSMGQVKKYGLRKGDAVQGSIRTPREGDRRNQRQKFVPLQAIDTINGMSVEEAANRPQFNKLTPLYPQERLKQESSPNKITGRLIDIVAPIGKGQRGLIVSPPKAGKTITLQNIANAIATNNPEVHLMVVLVDERPEEVTDMERTVQGEVISSTFDRPATDHTTVAELAIERAKRLVELGQDVVVLLDSMTRLARAYNISAPVSGRILSGGVDAQALYPPKKFFGAARNIENGGSLTIISSALVETGSKMDEVIFEEFKGTGNMELRLSRELADKRLFPAIDVNASGTRREELITPPAELPIIYRLRRLLGGMEPEQAYQTLVPRLKKTATNRDFLAAIIQQNGTNN